MVRKKIREYDSKRLLKEHLPRLAGIHLPICFAQVTESTDYTELLKKEAWLSSSRAVVKPDMLFGRRSKSGHMALNLDFAQVIEFMKQHLGVEVEIEGCKGPLTTFIVEPFIPHDQEYYLSISSERLGCILNFSDCGGIEIEENWDKVMSVFLPTEKSISVETVAPLLATLPLEVCRTIEKFIMGVFFVFQDLDFTFVEINPFTLVNGEVYPLDMRGELDECAAFRNEDKWGNVEFPLPFGSAASPEGNFIDALKQKSNATMKFTLLNRKGRIWNLISGGGSGLIYADAVGDLGYASELGNNTDYTHTSEEEMYQLGMTILNCATANPDGRKRALLLGANISSTTNIATTYDGFIRALREKKSNVIAAKLHIFVRRGGPNYQTGLAKMLAVGEELGVHVEVYGPELVMTGICKLAIECIES